MASVYRALPRVHGWLVLAADGSKEQLPRTLSNESVFGIADNGREPQSLISVIMEVQSGLPWDWRVDIGRGSEHRHLNEMIPDLPSESLLVADANYVGYPLWSAFNKAGRSFLVRVGSHVSLLEKLFPEARLVRSGLRVYAWPQAHQKDQPPLALRLIRVGKPGHWVWLL